MAQSAPVKASVQMRDDGSIQILAQAAAAKNQERLKAKKLTSMPTSLLQKMVSSLLRPEVSVSVRYHQIPPRPKRKSLKHLVPANKWRRCRLDLLRPLFAWSPERAPLQS